MEISGIIFIADSYRYASIRKFGHTIEEIERDGFHIDAKVPLDLLNDTGASMAQDVGKCICGLTDAFERIMPISY